MMDRHPLAGKRVRLRTGNGDPLNEKFYVVEDWWVNVRGSLRTSAGENPAVLHYMSRAKAPGSPGDELIVYGKIGALGYIVHESEIEEVA
jgi:hypothetical protein